jgi:acyl carrier protein
MMAVGGLKVYPAEVERILLDHQSVSQAAVVGFPDDVFGEQVVAFVVISTEASADVPALREILREHCRDNLASYKVPRHFVSLEELPRNTSGKILKTKLREYVLRGEMSTNAASADELAVHLPALSPATREPTLWNDLRRSYATNRLQVATTFVQGLIQGLTGEEHRLEPDTRFLEAGLDSLMIVEMSSRIQAEVGSRCEIPATLLFDCPRICDLAEFLIQTYEAHEKPSAQTNSAARQVVSKPSHDFAAIRKKIDAMSEDEALDELMRELESS